MHLAMCSLNVQCTLLLQEGRRFRAWSVALNDMVRHNLLPSSRWFRGGPGPACNTRCFWHAESVVRMPAQGEALHPLIRNGGHHPSCCAAGLNRFR